VAAAPVQVGRAWAATNLLVMVDVGGDVRQLALQRRAIAGTAALELLPRRHGHQSDPHGQPPRNCASCEHRAWPGEFCREQTAAGGEWQRSRHRDRVRLARWNIGAAIEPKGSAQMKARILVLATAAAMLAAPLSGAAQAGRLTDLAKASLKQNAKLVKKSIKLNAFVLGCALNKNAQCLP
jgi:hypothetical protein